LLTLQYNSTVNVLKQVSLPVLADGPGIHDFQSTNPTSITVKRVQADCTHVHHLKQCAVVEHDLLDASHRHHHASLLKFSTKQVSVSGLGTKSQSLDTLHKQPIVTKFYVLSSMSKPGHH
jgi:hypothetical protein